MVEDHRLQVVKEIKVIIFSDFTGAFLKGGLAETGGSNVVGSLEVVDFMVVAVVEQIHLKDLRRLCGGGSSYYGHYSYFRFN